MPSPDLVACLPDDLAALIKRIALTHDPRRVEAPATVAITVIRQGAATTHEFDDTPVDQPGGDARRNPRRGWLSILDGLSADGYTFRTCRPDGAIVFDSPADDPHPHTATVLYQRRQAVIA
ncbi:MAG: hypothetical protein IT340_19845 [Chloroflexi bacterium]|nr:hypothetical protein [Chloroflexota bacterium]